jgi:hypothetical protein
LKHHQIIVILGQIIQQNVIQQVSTIIDRMEQHVNKIINN